MAATLPRFVEPQLATLVTEVPTGDGWLHEIKYDGYRMLGRLEGGRAQLLSRRAKDWSVEFAPVATALGDLAARSAIVDGEVAVFAPDGSTSFQALQNIAAGGALGYMLFDLLFLDGDDLRGLPLEQRKQRLQALVAATASPVLRYADHVVGRGPDLWAQICAAGSIEGVVSKRRSSPYTSGRGGDWVKTKVIQRGTFVIGGFTPVENGPGLRGLLVGAFAGDQLVYAGRVGTGFSAREARALFDFLDQRRRTTPAFARFPGGAEAPPRSRWARPSSHSGPPVWVEPELVVEVDYLEWTDDDVLRQPSLRAVRPDARPADARRRR
jgi:bifunctional non-homologous end joining protein LigD